MVGPRRVLCGNKDLGWVVLSVLVSAAFVAILLNYLAARHDVYSLGYRVAALTEEHSRLFEDNRRLAVEAAVQSNAERLEIEALERLQLSDTEPEQIIRVQERP